VLLTGAGARAAALGLNRVLDRRIDALNPRTQSRELPSGTMNLVQAWGVIIAGLVIYLVGAAMLGKTCLLWSWVPLAVFVIYPLMKRFTWACHFGVGAGLALAPLGALIGVTNEVPKTTPIYWLAGFTFFWVAGFDTLYATLDEEFDKAHGIFSIPARFGKATAQDAALMMHALAGFCLVVLRWNAFSAKGPLIWLALVPVGTLLALEQQSGYSLEGNARFFKINAWVGVAAAFYIFMGVL
jgi:4-hydroxybenzoate polyprenyltransferase